MTRPMFTITVYKHNGDIEHTNVSASSEEEARAIFGARSTEHIVSIRQVLNPRGLEIDFIDDALDNNPHP